METNYVSVKHAKKVNTKNTDGEENGYILTLAEKGRKTTAYISVFYPHTFRGYHIHTERTNHIYCLDGEIVIHTKNPLTGAIDVTPLSAQQQDQIVIAPLIPTAIENIGLRNATVLFVPDPPYDPTNTGEMLRADRKDVEKPDMIALMEEQDE